LKTLAIIPARGGSEGIPRKNVRLLAGKPLIAHTIGIATQASSVNRVVVSTDDDEIATISTSGNQHLYCFV
jgi:N-acylneuraminate cytidylyltransferase